MQKTTFKTRLLALLTAAFMIVMCVPFAAFAEDAKLTKAHVSFKDAAWNDLYTTFDVTDWFNLPTTSNAINLAEDEEIVSWKDAKNNVYQPGEKVTLEQMAEIVGTNGVASDGTAFVTFEATVQKKVTKKPVYVSYILESGEPLANATEQIELENGATTFSTSLLKKVPAGYELCETGDVYIGENDTVNVKVREVKKPAKVVYVSYILESGEPLANAIEQIELENGATTFSTSLLKKVPAGYELCETGDVYIGTNDTVNVKVRETKKPAKVVYVSYILENGEPLANAIEKIELENGATTFNTSVLKEVPAGYELCETGDVYIGTNDTVNVKVREVKKPEVSLTKIKMIFTKADGATSVFATGELTAASEWYVLPDAAGVINLTASEKLTGWTLFQNGAKYAAGEKVTFESLKELAGKNVDKDGVAYLNFYADLKTDVELKNITIKYVEDKDGAQEDVAAPQNNFTAKDEFTILTDNLYDGKVPAGKKLIGWQYKNGGKTTNFVKGEHVKFDTLKALLNGNWDNVGNAWVTLTPVFQDVKSDNGNSSSSSSSSNTTNTSSSNTTNTSASQKQVVKAAAAPANTTKVLPKTGATNAAPLIGGSLAVVALLMGYGVYGLVLRKKD